MKKLIIFITISLFISVSVNAELILPNKDLKPVEVLKIQLKALKKNDIPSKDFGINQTWVFAHPNNKLVTGPLSKFTNMIYSESYKILINHHSHEIKEVFKNDFKYIYVVQITTKEKKFFLYEWHVEKGNEKNCNNCWFTSVVSSPIEQGSSI